MGRHITIAVTVLLVGLAAQAEAEVPQAVHYQGYLVDKAGDPVAGSQLMEFRLYETAAGGQPFWQSNGAVQVEVQNGVFNVELGPVGAVQLSGGQAHLGITIVSPDPGEPKKEMEPRLKVVSVPYALVAGEAETCGVCGTAGSVDGVNFEDYAKEAWVTEQLGVCIQEEDLVQMLQGYCQKPCYGDADVEVYLTENGIIGGDWIDETKLEEWLAANGYKPAGKSYGDQEEGNRLPKPMPSTGAGLRLKTTC